MTSKVNKGDWKASSGDNIALLKRTQKQVKIGYSVYIYKTTRIHFETILAVFPEIWFTEHDELTLLSADLSPSLMMDHHGFDATNAIFLCDHQNQLRDVIVQIFPLALGPVSRLLQIETKIS